MTDFYDLEQNNHLNDNSSTDFQKEETALDPNWAHDALQELEDFIESQGVYIRQ